jgi:hypothetical protein
MTNNQKRILDLMKPGEEKLRQDLEAEYEKLYGHFDFTLAFGWLLRNGYFLIKHDQTGNVTWPQVIRRRSIEEHHEFLLHNKIIK